MLRALDVLQGMTQMKVTGISRLATDQLRLQVEKRAQATPQRIETLARDKLQMKQASPAITQYVQEGSATGATVQ